MADWTKPYAYIIRMPGIQMREMHRADQSKMQALYDAHVARLMRKFGA